jgi:hypothetical protein
MSRQDRLLLLAAGVALAALLAALFLGYGEEAFLRMAEFYRACVEAFR